MEEDVCLEEGVRGGGEVSEGRTRLPLTLCSAPMEEEEQDSGFPFGGECVFVCCVLCVVLCVCDVLYMCVARGVWCVVCGV